MIRDCPQWFNDELAAAGGTNRYGDPVFQLVWSTEPKMVVGGRFADGFTGYRWKNAVPGKPCWALMMWEGPETYGDPVYWDIQYTDVKTGLKEMGEFPTYGRHRLLRRLEHNRLVQSHVTQMIDTPFGPGMKDLQPRRVETYLVEPSGFILDMMIPMLLAWRSLEPWQKMEATMEQKRLEELSAEKMTKDALLDCKVRRGSQLVQKRAELIERGMDQAMRMAAQFGPGMVSLK